MKAFRKIITKGFNAGIRPEDYSTRNSELFESCINGKPGKAGLLGYIPTINDIMSSARKFRSSVDGSVITITRQWPFPQVFMTDAGLYLGAKEGLYKITDPVVTKYPDIVLYSYGTGTTAWPWVCIPIPGYPAFTSGTKLLYYDENAAAYVVVI
jgi:hypothetical protein